MYKGTFWTRARAASACAVGALWLVACAEGYGQPGEVTAQLVMGEGGSTSTPGAGGVGAGAGGAAGAAGMAAPMFMGDACERGEVEACVCEGGGMGSRACQVDMTSPTGGAFAACGRCVMPELPEAGSGGASGSGAGASGAGGGAAGSPAGNAGSGSSGDAGSGGSSGGGCNPRDCDEPLLGSACCTDDDECGVRLLLSCNPR